MSLLSLQQPTCMTIYLPQLSSENYDFPPVDQALSEPNGLLAFGGDLQPQRIIEAYRNGIFPWYGPNEPILWWSPSPRAVFIPDSFIPSRSLKKFQRKTKYQVSINKATEQVIDYCASTRSAEETWLNAEMRTAYKLLTARKVCHSVEVWDSSGRLVGGLYGLSLGHMFCGESMFSLATNASKVALWYFCQHFSQFGGQLIDCQVMNPHLDSLGAVELAREEFFPLLRQLQKQPINNHCFAPQWLTHQSAEQHVQH